MHKNCNQKEYNCLLTRQKKESVLGSITFMAFLHFEQIKRNFIVKPGCEEIHMVVTFPVSVFVR